MPPDKEDKDDKPYGNVKPLASDEIMGISVNTELVNDIKLDFSSFDS